MTADGSDDPLLLVEAHLLSVLGQDSGRARVLFVGADPVDVLRFGPDPDDLVRYATVGMSRLPMTPAGADVLSADGPRAELVLTVRGPRDSVLRRLAALAASPVVEGVVIVPGAGIELGEPLWDGASFTAVLVGAPAGLVPDLTWHPAEQPVRFLPLLPMTAPEAAYKRVHGAQELEQLWLRQGLDLRHPHRPSAALERPTPAAR